MGEKWLTNDYIQTARKLTPIFRKNHQPPCKDIIPRNPLNKNCMIYVDDEAFAFETRKDMETGSYVVFKHYNRFGLQMHIGSKSKPSKTEYVFFSATGHFKLPTPPSTALPTDSSSSLPVIPKQKNRNG